MKENSRRQFLKGTIGTLGGTFLARLAGLFPEARPLLARSTQETVPVVRPPAQVDVGELYAGFLLLPDGSPLPDFVREPLRENPNVCGLGVGRGGSEPTAVTRSFERVEDLSEAIGFPIYTLIRLDDEVRFLGARLIEHETGEVFAVSLLFQTRSVEILPPHEVIEETEEWETTMQLWALPDFARPFPIWSSEPVEPESSGIVLEKVNFLPTPGVMVDIQDGYMFHWIEQGVLYKLIMEHNPSFEDAKDLVNSLLKT